MKQRFLIFLVAFLFCCAGCGKQKKKVKPLQQKPGNTLITRSSDKVVQASRLKNKEEEVGTLSLFATTALVSYSSGVKERIAEIEARLGDVLVPLMVKGVEAYEEGKGRYVMIYETSLALPELSHFYNSEMERLGWGEKVAFSLPQELLFSFKKYKQSCIVSVRSFKKSWWGTKPAKLYVYLQT